MMIVLMLGGSRASAQLFFQNPSFDGTPCSHCTPSGWHTCFGTPDVLPDSSNLYALNVTNPVHGATVIGIGAAYFSQPSVYEAFGQRVTDCIANETVFFSLYSKCGIDTSDGRHFFGGGALKIFGSVDSCGVDQYLWHSPLMDSTWLHLNVLLQPTAEIDYLRFQASNSEPCPQSICSWYIYVDHLSPIYIVQPGGIAIEQSDTAIYKGNCLYLSATTGSSADSVWWQSGQGGYIVEEWVDAGQPQCPDSTRQYYAFMLSKQTPDTCVGRYISIDTITVTVIDTTTALQEPSAPSPPLLYPNPARQSCTLHTAAAGRVLLHNALGQLLLQQAVPAGRSSLPLQGLPAGLYIATFTPAHCPAWRGRLVVE